MRILCIRLFCLTGSSTYDLEESKIFNRNVEEGGMVWTISFLCLLYRSSFSLERGCFVRIFRADEDIGRCG